MIQPQVYLANREISSASLNFLWLEITGKCNLACAHCYAESSPQAAHGAMTCIAWEHVILSAHNLGCRSVQFIGGEPTTYPHLARLIKFAHCLEMNIEIYSNLVSVRPQLWEVFQSCNVSIATSFYSAKAEVHDRITAGRGSFAKTVANIQQVMRVGLPLRAGLISMHDDQDIEEAQRFLRDLGVQRIGVDRVRSVGRGAQLGTVNEKPEDALCGRCANDRAAVTPSGNVYPCVFSRWLPLGNVLQESLADVVSGETMRVTRQALQASFSVRSDALNCMPRTESYMVTQDLSALLQPDPCPPHQCPPNTEDGECNPDASCTPKLCIPDFRQCSPEQYPPCSPDKEACPPDWD